MARAARVLRVGPFQLPVVVAGLFGAMTIVSLACVILARNGVPGVREGVVLMVPAVLAGQVWRLVSWPLLELDPIGLLFAALTLLWVGGDLARTWGGRRFLGVFFGLAAAVGLVASLVVALALGPHTGVMYVGAGAVLGGLIVAWSREHRGREIRLYGVLRVQGRHLLWITLGVTTLFALYLGLVWAIPHFAAQGLVLLAYGPFRRLGKRRRDDKGAQARAKSFEFSEWLDREWRKR